MPGGPPGPPAADGRALGPDHLGVPGRPRGPPGGVGPVAAESWAVPRQTARPPGRCRPWHCRSLGGCRRAVRGRGRGPIACLGQPDGRRATDARPRGRPPHLRALKLRALTAARGQPCNRRPPPGGAAHRGRHSASAAGRDPRVTGPGRAGRTVRPGRTGSKPRTPRADPCPAGPGRSQGPARTDRTRAAHSERDSPSRPGRRMDAARLTVGRPLVGRDAVMVPARPAGEPWALRSERRGRPPGGGPGGPRRQSSKPSAARFSRSSRIARRRERRWVRRIWASWWRRRSRSLSGRTGGTRRGLPSASTAAKTR